MLFNEDFAFSSINAEKVLNKECIVANTLHELKYKVIADINPTRIVDVISGDYPNRFVIDESSTTNKNYVPTGIISYNLAYCPNYNGLDLTRLSYSKKTYCKVNDNVIVSNNFNDLRLCIERDILIGKISENCYLRRVKEIKETDFGLDTITEYICEDKEHYIFAYKLTDKEYKDLVNFKHEHGRPFWNIKEFKRAVIQYNNKNGIEGFTKFVPVSKKGTPYSLWIDNFDNWGVYIGNIHLSYNSLFENYIFADDSICGVADASYSNLR